MNPERLQQLISAFASLRVAVLGDFFLDKYLDTDPALAEISVETGRSAHQVTGIRRSAGAAGTVVNNLSALGAGTLHAIGGVGDDGEAFDLRRCLKDVRCSTTGLLSFDSLMTPTYLKPRDQTNPGLTGEYDRYDTKNRRPTPSAVSQQVLAALDQVLPHVDGVIVIDQVTEENCGMITAQVRDAVAERARRSPHVIFCADSRRHIQEFRHVIVKPNQFEALGIDRPAPGTVADPVAVRQRLPAMRQQIGAPVCVTLSERGMLVSDPEVTLVPGFAVEGPIDSTGAGDSATAGLVLALAAGATLPEAALVGNLVASITIQQLATTGTATPVQLAARLDAWHGQQERRR